MTSTTPPSRPVVVVVGGTRADRPVLRWAAEEAVELRRPLLIAHGVGHLSPQLGYAERHQARRALQDTGQQVVDEAARWVAREAPGVTLETAVRLLAPDALLEAMTRDACLVVRTSSGWADYRPAEGPEPVVVRRDESGDDAHVLAYATDYARRRDCELVLEGAAAARSGSVGAARAGLAFSARSGGPAHHADRLVLVSEPVHPVASLSG